MTPRRQQGKFPEGEKPVRFSLRLTAEEANAMDERAGQHGRSFNEEVREAIRQFLETLEDQKNG